MWETFPKHYDEQWEKEIGETGVSAKK